MKRRRLEATLTGAGTVQPGRRKEDKERERERERKKKWIYLYIKIGGNWNQCHHSSLWQRFISGKNREHEGGRMGRWWQQGTVTHWHTRTHPHTESGWHTEKTARTQRRRGRRRRRDADYEEIAGVTSRVAFRNINCFSGPFFELLSDFCWRWPGGPWGSRQVESPSPSPFPPVSPNSSPNWPDSFQIFYRFFTDSLTFSWIHMDYGLWEIWKDCLRFFPDS